MIMKDKTLCKTCIHGEVLAGSYFCNRCYDENGKFYPKRVAKRTENFCYDYIEKGQNKMDIIKEEIKEPETTTVIEEKPQRHIWTVGEIKQLIELYNQGMKTTAISDKLGISKEKVKNELIYLKQSEKWKNYFTVSEPAPVIEEVRETVSEPETTFEEVRETSQINIKDLKVHFADFVIDECRREEVPGVVELVGAYLKYLEKRVKE